MNSKPKEDSDEELPKKLRGENPMHLRAFRPSNPPRPTHPDFIGPVHPDWKKKTGRIVYDEDGQAWFNW